MEELNMREQLRNVLAPAAPVGFTPIGKLLVNCNLRVYDAVKAINHVLKSARHPASVEVWCFGEFLGAASTESRSDSSPGHEFRSYGAGDSLTTFGAPSYKPIAFVCPTCKTNYWTVNLEHPPTCAVDSTQLRKTT